MVMMLVLEIYLAERTKARGQEGKTDRKMKTA